jgi:hypothetical protein
MQMDVNSNLKYSRPARKPLSLLITYRPMDIDTIIHRRQALIGASARHVASSRSFDDLAREAEVANAA